MSQTPHPGNQPQHGPQGPVGPQGQPGPYGAPGPGQTGTTYAPPPAPKKRRVWLWVLIGILAIFLVLGVSCAAVVGSAVNEASKSVASAEPNEPELSDAPTGQATEEPAGDPTEEASDEPADDPTEAADDPTEEPEPKVSKEQKAFDALSDEAQEAVGSGEDYLETLPFSKAGLIDQLSSDYGAQYERKDAKKAVEFLEDYRGVSWKKQAVRAAKSYRETMHFSRQGLIDQLESDYGAQFTHEQAVYGADHSR